MKHELCGRHWIEGGWKAAGDETFVAVNPATGETLTPHFAEATIDDVDAAVSAARDAFLIVREHDPLWPAELLDAIASQIEALGDVLLDCGEAETALPRPRLTGERARTCGPLRRCAQILKGRGSRP